MKRTLLIILTITFAVACRENKQPQPFSVIPMPNDVTLAEGSFNVAGAPVSYDENVDAASAKAIDGFVKTLETVTGKAGKNGKNGGIHFGLNPNLGAEEYFLQVKPDGVNVEASAFGGFFYAIQTLKQMLPAEVYGAKKAKAAWLLPCVTILDAPRFDYRGIHLDPCRHFWSIEETKRYIDIAATYKLNRLHWHLTEDQGWRMEIKKYPKLTEVGAWRSGTCIGKDFDSTATAVSIPRTRCARSWPTPPNATSPSSRRWTCPVTWSLPSPPILSWVAPAAHMKSGPAGVSPKTSFAWARRKPSTSWRTS